MNTTNTGKKAAWLRNAAGPVLCFAALAVSCLIYACSSPVDGETGDASFSVTINGGRGRAAATLSWDPTTEISALEHTIILTDNSGSSVKREGVKAGQSAQFSVAPGHWDITVKAFLIVDGVTVLKAEGIGNVDLIPGPNGIVSITMGQPGGEIPVTKETFPITMQNDGNGITTAAPNPAAAGDTVTVHAEPHDGYMFKEWEVISGDITLSDTTKSTAEFTMPSGPVTIRAEFEEVPPDTPVLSMTTVEFEDVTYGYSQPSAQTVTIHNAGNTTADVDITISGTGASSFILGSISTSTIEAGANAAFTVQPNDGLDVGIHTATITAAYSGGVVKNKTETMDVSFTVHATVIDTVEINIEAPVNGAAPNINASGTGSYIIGPVSWSPFDNPFLGGKVYTAEVTLTAKSGHTFTGLSTADINGQGAVKSDNTGSAVTLSYTFPETDTRKVTDVAITTQPAKMDYTHGDVLNLTGLAVTLTYDDTSTEEIIAANFGARNITANPSHGDNLIHSTHNGQPVKITYGVTCNTGNLTVNKAVPAAADYIISGTGTFDYNGKIRDVSIAPREGKSDGHITVKYNGDTSAPSAVGAYTVTFDAAEGTNYTAKSGLNAGTLTINPGAADLTIEVIPAQTYTGAAITPAVTVWDGLTKLTQNTDYTATYAHNTNAGTATVTVTGAGNYAGSSGTKTFTINPKIITFAIEVIPARTYTGAAITPAVTVKDDAKTLTLTTDYTVTYSGNTNAGTATVTVTGAGNYAGSSGTRTFTINKAAGAAVSTPTLNAKTYNSITINAVPAPGNGQSVEYGYSLSPDTTPSTWQSGLTFSSLNAVTTYYFFARAAENANYETGAASGGLEVTTLQSVSDAFTYDLVDTHGNLIITGETTVNAGTTLTFTAQGEGYNVVGWYLNGVNTQQTENTYNFSSWVTGKHTVGLVVTKDNNLYNTTITITVQ